VLPLAHLELLLHPIVVSTYRENSETFGEPSKSISEELSVSLECYRVLAWASKLKLEDLLLLVIASARCPGIKTHQGKLPNGYSLVDGSLIESL